MAGAYPDASFLRQYIAAPQMIRSKLLFRAACKSAGRETCFGKFCHKPLSRRVLEKVEIFADRRRAAHVPQAWAQAQAQAQAHVAGALVPLFLLRARSSMPPNQRLFCAQSAKIVRMQDDLAAFIDGPGCCLTIHAVHAIHTIHTRDPPV
jgi:hypothetical protein